LYRRTLDLARHPSYKSQHERKYFSEFDPLAVRPDSSTGSELKAVEEACRETCMMDVEPEGECSCTMVAMKTIEPRRHGDENPNIQAH
jgi:hypothetical protein